MAGLVPAIHVLLVGCKEDVDARDKRGMTVGRRCKTQALPASWASGCADAIHFCPSSIRSCRVGGRGGTASAASRGYWQCARRTAAGAARIGCLPENVGRAGGAGQDRGPPLLCRHQRACRLSDNDPGWAHSARRRHADSAEVIEELIHKLGFNPRDIKLLLITHAHIQPCRHHGAFRATVRRLGRGDASRFRTAQTRRKDRSCLWEHGPHSSSRRLRPSAY